mmetsp:Transcript_128007/g.410157  ORF Transcript_128007/g.410157 Transcript_128007/m.410157 type:complete len:222 (+) Transcript_128007:554-1219(+)
MQYWPKVQSLLRIEASPRLNKKANDLEVTTGSSFVQCRPTADIFRIGVRSQLKTASRKLLAVLLGGQAQQDTGCLRMRSEAGPLQVEVDAVADESRAHDLIGLRGPAAERPLQNGDASRRPAFQNGRPLTPTDDEWPWHVRSGCFKDVSKRSANPRVTVLDNLCPTSRFWAPLAHGHQGPVQPQHCQEASTAFGPIRIGCSTILQLIGNRPDLLRTAQELK